MSTLSGSLFVFRNIKLEMHCKAKASPNNNNTRNLRDRKKNKKKHKKKKKIVIRLPNEFACIPDEYYRLGE